MHFDWLKFSNIFLSETTLPMELLYCVNDPLVVLYQNRVFGADPKSKMAAIAGQNLTLDPMGNTLKDLLVGNNYDS